ncbi:LptF/LptG family permease [Flavobacteriales bacterium]|nr:LptF/LptG family permease [Flavobacteriales bacterium]
MKKFDYYIIKHFLWTFGLTISLILAIAVVFDFSEKIDNFLEHNAPTKLIINDYYINFLIHYGVVFSGLITFVSVIFFTSRLSENNEIIALYNNKISPYRILVPYMISAMIIFIPNIYFQNNFLPSKNEARLNFETKYIKNKDVLREKKMHKQIDKNTFLFIDNYDIKNKTGYHIDIQNFTKDRIIYKISGSSMNWEDDKKKWKIKNFKKHILTQSREINHIDKKEELIDLNITPSEIFQQTRSIKSMNFKELNQIITLSKKIGNELLPIYQIERNERFSYPFSIFIFTLLGFLISNKKIRGGLGYKLTAGLAICFLYIFIMKFTVTFTMNGNISAFISVWMPNAMCLLISIMAFKRLT